MSTEPAPEPLTAEEERELRADIAHGPEGRALQVYGDDVLRLLATLDRERAATPSSVTPDLRAALRDILALAEGDAPLSEHYRREIERIARAVLASATPSEPTLDAAPELRAALDVEALGEAIFRIGTGYRQRETATIPARIANSQDGALASEEFAEAVAVEYDQLLSAPSRSRD